MGKAWVGLIGLLVACSAHHTGDAPFTACGLGSLTGTWRTHATQTDGDCGALPDQTVNLAGTVAAEQSDAGVTGAGRCTYAAQSTSSDKCEQEADYTCPLGGGSSAHYVEVSKQTSPTTIVVTLTVTARGSIACTSTYDVTWTKL